MLESRVVQESVPEEGLGPGDHPAAEILHRFVAGEATREEARQVVRHLLSGCPDCKLITARLWNLGEAPAPRRRGRRGLRLVKGDR